MRGIFSLLAVMGLMGGMGSVAEPAKAQDRMPEFLAGKSFTGVGIQISGDKWQADFEFADVQDPSSPSKVINKTVACEANLFAVDVQPDRVIFKQRITKGKDICIDLGYVEVVDDNLTGLVLMNYSSLRVMQPVETRAVIFDKAVSNPTEAEMSEVTENYAPVTPSIIGSWEKTGSGSWLSPRCDQFWDRTDKPWLPFDARGAISVWAIPTEEGGKIFAAYAEDFEGKKVTWSELKHWNESSFKTDSAFLWKEEPVFLDVGETPNGQEGWLIIAPEGSDRFRWEYSARCLPAQAQ